MKQASGIKCDKCNKMILIRYLEAGDRIKCPHCGYHMTIPPEFKPVKKEIEPNYSSPGSWKPPAYKEKKPGNSRRNGPLSREEQQAIYDK